MHLYRLGSPIICHYLEISLWVEIFVQVKHVRFYIKQQLTCEWPAYGFAEVDEGMQLKPSWQKAAILDLVVALISSLYSEAFWTTDLISCHFKNM